MRRPNIPIDIKEKIKSDVKKTPGIWFIDEVLKRTGEYKNKKQTLELLTEIASFDCIKNLSYKGMEGTDFSDNARKLIVSVGCKDEYTDPDSFSLLLYMVFGKLLSRKNVLSDYTIAFRNNAFGIDGEYEYCIRSDILCPTASRTPTSTSGAW